jgi:hypothetical protein
VWGDHYPKVHCLLINFTTAPGLMLVGRDIFSIHEQKRYGERNLCGSRSVGAQSYQETTYKYFKQRKYFICFGWAVPRSIPHGHLLTI